MPWRVHHRALFLYEKKRLVHWLGTQNWEVSELFRGILSPEILALWHIGWVSCPVCKSESNNYLTLSQLRGVPSNHGTYHYDPLFNGLSLHLHILPPPPLFSKPPNLISQVNQGSIGTDSWRTKYLLVMNIIMKIALNYNPRQTIKCSP